MTSQFVRSKDDPFTYRQTACKMAKAVKWWRKDLRCRHCPFEECISGNPRLARQFFAGYVANLMKVFGITEDLKIGDILGRLNGDNRGQ